MFVIEEREESIEPSDRLDSFVQRKIDVKISRDGNKVIVLTKDDYLRKKPFSIDDKEEVPIFKHGLVVFGFSQNKSEFGRHWMVFEDAGFFETYYRSKEVREVDFLTEEEDCLFVVFDDELLLLSIKERQFHAFFGIKVCFEVRNTVFWGRFNRALIYRKNSDKEKKTTMRSKSVEWIGLDDLIKKVKAIEDRKTKFEKVPKELEDESLNDEVENMKRISLEFRMEGWF